VGIKLKKIPRPTSTLIWTLLFITIFTASCSVSLKRPKAIQMITSLGAFGRVHYWEKEVTQHGVTVFMPNQAPVIVSDYHSQLGVKSGSRPTHKGIDIYARSSTPILASADGVILDAVNEKCWGPSILIDHGQDENGDPLLAIYGHLGKMFVKAGEKVKRGQKIAEMGPPLPDCGAGLEHLHFQISRSARGGNKRDYWGHSYFVRDASNAPNPHQFWANGVGRVTCFKYGKLYKKGTLTYPVSCLRK